MFKLMNAHNAVCSLRKQVLHFLKYRPSAISVHSWKYMASFKRLKRTRLMREKGMDYQYL